MNSNEEIINSNNSQYNGTKNKLIFLTLFIFFLSTLFLSYYLVLKEEFSRAKENSLSSARAVVDQIEHYSTNFERESNLLTSINLSQFATDSLENNFQSFILKSYLHNYKNFVSSIVFQTKDSHWRSIEINSSNYLIMTDLPLNSNPEILLKNEENLFKLAEEYKNPRFGQVFAIINVNGFLNQFLDKLMLIDLKTMILFEKKQALNNLYIINGICKARSTNDINIINTVNQKLFNKLDFSVVCNEKKFDLIGAVHPVTFLHKDFSLLVGLDKKIVRHGLEYLSIVFGLILLLFLIITFILYLRINKQERQYFEERELLQLKMVNASRLSLLGEMAAGFAHEINSPLQIILNSASIAKKDLIKIDGDKLKIEKNLERIEKTSIRLAKIVQGLRIYSRNSELDNFQIANLIKIIEDVLDMAEEKLHIHQVQIKNLLPKQEILINAVESQIGQVILNIINNAIDAIDENISSKERWIKIDLSDEGDKIKLSIQNSGMLIPVEIRDKMMRPFFTTKIVGKGTGLGLSISQGVINKHKGKFYLDENKEFTTFVIELPKN